MESPGIRFRHSTIDHARCPKMKCFVQQCRCIIQHTGIFHVWRGFSRYLSVSVISTLRWSYLDNQPPCTDEESPVRLLWLLFFNQPFLFHDVKI